MDVYALTDLTTPQAWQIATGVVENKITLNQISNATLSKSHINDKLNGPK